MSFWVIPVRMTAIQTHIHADRRLAFQVLTAFGSTDESGASSRVLKDEGGHKLVEFHSVIPSLFGRSRTYRTVERVTLREPDEIAFEGVDGPLDQLRDRFVLSRANGCTWFTYESTVGIKGWAAGWLIARLYVRPLLGRFMREHVARLKLVIENRAGRSGAFPQRTCECSASPTHVN